MRIRAAVLEQMGKQPPYSVSKPLVIEELDLEEPDQDEVLVKMWYVGLCHSDLSVINGSRPRPTPMVLGHEAMGQILQIGPGVDNVSVGDLVTCIFVPGCGQCDGCRIGRPTTCVPGAEANKKGVLLCGKTHLFRTRTTEKQPVYHMGGTSGFATHAVLSKHSVVKVDPNMPPEYAALLGCCVITGVGAITNSAKVAFGSSVAIVGLGGVGLCGLLGAKACGASFILAVDLEERKLAKAKEFGATHTFLVQRNDPLSKTLEQIRNQISPNGKGVDYAFEMAGSGPALQIAYGITKPGGTTVTIGLPDPSVDLSIQQVSITAEERTLIGSYLGSGVAIRDLPRYVELYKKGSLPLEKLVSGIIPLSQINEGFDMLEKGEVIRVLVKLIDEI